MLSRFRARLTYANVVSTICLFILLGGSAVALDVVPFAEKAGFAKKARKAKKAKKAKKAGKVDGLSASTTPEGGKLLALDGGAKFPASVFPNGTKGPKGDKGATGATGPTYGFAVGGDGAPDLSSREAVFSEQNFSIPIAGKLYLSARVSQAIDCDTGDIKYGIYVDDIPVPGSGRTVEASDPADPDPDSRFVELAGVTGTLAAGRHKVSVGLDCYLGNYTGGTSWPDTGFTGILLGG